MEEKKKRKKKSVNKSAVVCDCRNQGKVSLSPNRQDPDNEKSEQRRRVGTGHILHSAAPVCLRLKVARHLCHVGPGTVWAGGQGQGNICIASECLAARPHQESVAQRYPEAIDLKRTKCFLWIPAYTPFSNAFVSTIYTIFMQL